MLQRPFQTYTLKFRSLGRRKLCLPVSAALQCARQEDRGKHPHPVFHAIQTAIEQLEQVKLGETDNYDSGESESAEGPRRRNPGQLNS